MTAAGDSAGLGPTGPSTTNGQAEPVSAAEQEAFAALVAGSIPAVRSAVQAWRTGLTALITLVTTGIIVTGRTAIASLSTGWRAVITLMIGGGLALAVAGLWHALAAEVGDRTRLHTLADLHSRHASVAAYQVALANAAGRRLQTARTTVTIALGLLVTGVFLTWWAPAAPTNPLAYLNVNHQGAKTCGTLLSADGGVLDLAIPGAHEPAVIPLTTVTNFTLMTSCPAP